jgi:hypothetical protein
MTQMQTLYLFLRHPTNHCYSTHTIWTASNIATREMALPQRYHCTVDGSAIDKACSRLFGASGVAVSQWCGVVIGSTSPCQKVYSLKREISTRNSMNRDVSKVGSIDKALKWNLQADSRLFFLLKWPKLDLKSGSINGSWWWNWNWKKTWSN